MVSISDIPFLGKAVDKISEAAADAGFRGLRYLLCYNSIVNNLDNEIEKVKVQEEEVCRKADADRADGKIIKDHVIKWQKSVDEISTRVHELSKQRHSWNPVARFRLGRKAAHEAKNVADLTLSGEKLLDNEIAFLPAVPNIPISDTEYQKFDSREEAYGKLWEALVKEDKNQIIGIYGMPGVGKTRMMEEAWKEAKEKKIFDKVTRANAGAETIDVLKLQNQLSGYLGCHLESEDNEVLRASQLENSLINGGKTLVVLDDVWDRIPLQKIGIPIVAKKVCKECAGLPLLIQAVGNALECATEDSWKDALSQLENCNLEEIDGIDSRVYTGIRLSFDKLKKAEKRCLLLCSLFPEDAEIGIKTLEDFATGSQLLDRTRNVKGVVDNLKSSSLLLEGKTRSNVKVHDIIRDVARSIAATDLEYAFLFVTGDSCLPDHGNYSNRKLLQVVDSGSFQFPTDMVCPDLHTLWLERNSEPLPFSNNFFEGIHNLKILVFKGVHIFPQKISVQSFDNLTMLILDGCDFNEMFLSIFPDNLEILRISKCSLPSPLDLSKLKSLRKLEVQNDSEIEMVHNAMSTLPPSLAELHIPRGFRICNAEGMISLPISLELNKLTALKSLNIRLEDSKSCPNENIVANLLDYIIDVGDTWYAHESGIRSVIFSNRCIEGGGKVLVERAEAVTLMDVEGSPNGLSNNVDAFLNLRRLSIYTCKDMEYLACIPIQQSQPLTSFSLLTSLEIRSCAGLEYLFPASVAECLAQLQDLVISDCPTLEVVVWNESTSDRPIIKFPKLKDLFLEGLPSVVRFYGEITSRSSSSTTTTENAATSIPAGPGCLFNGMVAFPALEALWIDSLEPSEFWGKDCCKNNSFTRLKTLGLADCHNLEFAIPLAMLPTFQNLEELEIWRCDSMTSEVEISSSNESSKAKLQLLALRSIKLMYMPALTQPRLNQYSSINIYPSLEVLYITGCKSLRNVFLPSTAKNLMHLQTLLVSQCQMMSVIIGEEESSNELVFPELRELTLQDLPNFKRFCFNELMEVGGCGAPALFSCSFFRNLHQFQKLVLSNCPSLEEVVREEKNDVNSSGKTISLLQLESIELNHLPKLKSFSGSSSYAFNMPALKFIILGDCPQVEYFTCLEIRTPLIANFSNQNPETTKQQP